MRKTSYYIGYPRLCQCYANALPMLCQCFANALPMLLVVQQKALEHFGVSLVTCYHCHYDHCHLDHYCCEEEKLTVQVASKENNL